jgi:hypothetical protein
MLELTFIHGPFNGVSIAQMQSIAPSDNVILVLSLWLCSPLDLAAFSDS